MAITKEEMYNDVYATADFLGATAERTINEVRENRTDEQGILLICSASRNWSKNFVSGETQEVRLVNAQWCTNAHAAQTIIQVLKGWKSENRQLFHLFVQELISMLEEDVLVSKRSELISRIFDQGIGSEGGESFMEFLENMLGRDRDANVD